MYLQRKSNHKTRYLISCVLMFCVLLLYLYAYQWDGSLLGWVRILCPKSPNGESYNRDTFRGNSFDESGTIDNAKCDYQWWMMHGNYRRYLPSKSTCAVDPTPISSEAHWAARVFACKDIFIQSLQKACEDLPDVHIRDMLGALNSSIFQQRHLSYADKWTILIMALKSCGYEQRLPDAMIIGFKKSGTTLCEDLLLKHPQLASPFEFETHFFDVNYNNGFEYYKSQMGFATKDMCSFEKTPKYVRTPDAPINIAKYLPKHIKFMLLVKNPVDRAISEFRHERYNGIGPKIENRHSVTQDTEGRVFDQIMIRQDGSVNTENEIIDSSVYYKHFKNWLAVFPRERFLIIEHDTLIKNASHVLRQIEQFLRLRPFFQDVMFTRGVRNEICFTSPGKRKVCPGLKRGGIPKPKPSKKTLRQLCDFFEPFNREFEQLTGMTFDWNTLECAHLQCNKHVLQKSVQQINYHK